MSSGTKRTAHGVAIARLAAGGDGVGRLGGKVIFVPLTAPGDVCVVTIVEERPTFLRGRLLGLETPSPHRVTPRCALFGTCGGCSWQHVGPALQLEAKRSILEDALARIGRFGHPPVPAAVASPAAYGYRHRVRLHVGVHRGRAVFGFYRPGSRDLVPAGSCPVLHPALERLLPALGEAGRRRPDLFAQCEELRADTDCGGSRVRLALRLRHGAPAEFPPGILDDILAAAGPGVPEILAGPTADRPLRLGPDPDALETTGAAFTQVNLEQNRALVRLAMDWAAPRAGEEVLDLYCGLGNLSLPAAARGAAVLGVDLDPEAVRQAVANARRLGRPGAEFRAGDAAAAAGALAAAGRRFGLVLLNPPRTGAREAAAAIPALAPSRVLMVSCDPATFARDAALLRAGGYVLSAVQPLDLFPQTAHVETVGLFAPSSLLPGAGV
jgi:23S rRNA (uracil1939-C5)-methyltransferase